jgi:hypothetical protein
MRDAVPGGTGALLLSKRHDNGKTRGHVSVPDGKYQSIEVLPRVLSSALDA